MCTVLQSIYVDAYTVCTVVQMTDSLYTSTLYCAMIRTYCIVLYNTLRGPYKLYSSVKYCTNWLYILYCTYSTLLGVIHHILYCEVV